MAVKFTALSAIFGLFRTSSLLAPALAHPPPTGSSNAEIFDSNCAHFVFRADQVRLRVNDACYALKNSPELSSYPAYLKDDNMFGEENSGKLLSWPLYRRNLKYQEGKAGPFRVILTTSCKLVAIAVVHKPQNANEEARLVPCPQFIIIGNARGPIRNEGKAGDELARFRCGEEIMFTKKLASDLVDRGCKVEVIKHEFILKGHQKNLFSNTQLWMYPAISTEQNLRRGNLNYYGAVFDNECNLHGMIYSEGGDIKRCAEAKIVWFDSNNAENRLSDPSGETALARKRDKVSCAGQNLSQQMIRDNLNIAESLLEEKLRNPAVESKYPMMTQEGRVWLWPIRSQENISGKYIRKPIFFMLGIDSGGKLVDVYYTTSRTPDIRKYTRCKKTHRKSKLKDSKVTLELPVVIHNLDGEEV